MPESSRLVESYQNHRGREGGWAGKATLQSFGEQSHGVESQAVGYAHHLCYAHLW